MQLVDHGMSHLYRSVCVRGDVPNLRIETCDKGTF